MKASKFSRKRRLLGEQVRGAWSALKEQRLRQLIDMDEAAASEARREATRNDTMTLQMMQENLERIDFLKLILIGHATRDRVFEVEKAAQLMAERAAVSE